MAPRPRSGNGTFVNGSRVREQCLRHGDRVRVGSTEFRFEWVDGPVHEPPTLPASHAQQRRQSEAQPDRTLRMSAPHQDDTWTMPPTDRGARLVATAAIGGFAVAAVMIVGGLLALYVVDFDWRGSAQAQQVAPFEVPQEAKATLAKHLKRGHSHFENGSYLQAASQFYAAQKLVDGHPESERMAVRSTEALLLDTLREGLVLQACLRRSSACVARSHCVWATEHSRVEPTAARRRMRYGMCWSSRPTMPGFAR